MNELLSLLLISVSLSMDTFSVCLSIGTMNISKSKIIKLSLLIGIMHFFMPLLGNLIGSFIIKYLNINMHILLGIILIFIAIEMILDLKKEEKVFNLNMLGTLLVAISVSLDSFSTGIGLKALTSNTFLASTMFSVTAASFTYIGLLIGKYSNEKLGNYATIGGIILLIIIGIINLFE